MSEIAGTEPGGTEDALAPGVSEERHPYYWVALWTVLALMLVMALMGSFGKKPTEKLHEPEQLILRQVVSQRAIMNEIGDWGQVSPPDMDKKFLDSLDSTIQDLLAQTATDPMAERLYAAMRYEQGENIPPRELVLLSSSAAPADRAFAQIYLSPKLDERQARALAAQMPDKPFVYKLAKLHALQKAGLKVDRRSIINVPKAIAGLLALGIGAPLVAIVSGCVWMFYLSMRRAGKLQPNGLPLASISKGDADRLALRAVQLILGFLLIQIVVGGVEALVKQQLGKSVWPPGVDYLVVGALMVAYVFVLQRIPIAGKTITLPRLGVNKEQWGRHLLWGVCGYFAEIPLMVIAAVVGTKLFFFVPAPEHPAATQLQEGAGPLAVLGILTLGCIVAPFWEEICFRGLIFQGLGRLYANIALVAVADGLIFASIHPQGIAAWAALAVVGGISCALVYQTKSLVPSMVMHCCHNLSLMLLQILLS